MSKSERCPTCGQAVRADASETERVAAALRDQLGLWIADHPNADYFDWDVLAETALEARED